MEYDIIYSKRKTVGLCIKGGRLIVRAPRGTKTSYIEALIEKHSAWIVNAMERERKKRKLTETLSEKDIAEIKKEAKLYFDSKCREFAQIMGLSYGRITITSAKTRFGSCSSKKNISFSYRLMLYPEAAREYVVVHELAHLVHMNHSPTFYSVIEKYMPDYKKRKALLKLS